MFDICLEHQGGALLQDLCILILLVIGFFVIRELLCFIIKTNRILEVAERIEQRLKDMD